MEDIDPSRSSPTPITVLLNLPYRVVSIVSGALNDAAAKKYDLEEHFPASNAYRELVSCSNCTHFQSRKLEIRFGQKKSNEQGKQYCHLLNSTLTATERTLCCILENYQQEDGVEIPTALQPFIPFQGRPSREAGKGPVLVTRPKGNKLLVLLNVGFICMVVLYAILFRP
ncbi:serine--tRNA ligase-like [Papaver somniferum]|uniref:serine--tRNA ligase-like n=1 Tax=Papaver somniferum TaxID=3469 RepID=UPI000E6F92F6|nr:serine--tRNA ligase-like [Papaver somniferum]